MQDPPVTLRSLILSILCACVFLGYLTARHTLSHVTTIVFCDVGQGDATYLRIANRVDILIDAGPDRKILTCLGKHMPFFDRTIEFAFMSHPQKDHYGGFAHVLDRYHITHFVASGVGSPNKSFQAMWLKLKQKGTVIKHLYAKDSLTVKGGKLELLWPSEDFVKLHASKETTNGHYGASARDLLYSSGDLNIFSQVMTFSYHNLTILFTGDITTSLLENNSSVSIPQVSVLKVPHHGSKNGLTADFIKLADPHTSVISTGKGNSYGHPHTALLELLSASGSKIRRTDEEGSLVFEAK